MASVAAVAADAARSPLPAGEQNDELDTTGFITSNHDPADQPSSRLTPPESDNEDANGLSGGDAGLFGSDDDDEPAADRLLDDEELDSGDDEDRNDRVEEDEKEEEQVFLDVQFGRHPIPDPSDGELYLLRMPRFLSIEPYAFQPETFQPPQTDHHSADAPSSTFSAYNTALSTIRWRHSPSDPSKLESNARFLRWSDGSLTLQLASDPKTQYLVPGNPLAPPQQNPPKPTPTSRKARKGRNDVLNTKYNSEKDSFTYLAAPQESSQLVRITNKITAGLSIVPSAGATDDALERLQNSLAAAVRGHNLNSADGGIGMISITEDPELAKKKAEVAEKDKLKAQRRREAQEIRIREKNAGIGGRRGFASGGLTVGGLEGDEETGRPRPSGLGAKRSRPRRQNRRGEIYSDEEEEYGKRVRTKEDEYDEEDDFVAKSDEEEEPVDDDDDDDDGIGEPDSEAEPREIRRLQRPETPKRDRAQADEGDAANEVGPEGSPLARAKRRRVIEDDDEDE